MEVDFRNPEGYPDPTAAQAIRNVLQEERKYRPLIYICSPYADAPEENRRKAISYSRFAVDEGMIPIAPHLLLPLYMKESSERGLALFMGLVFLSKCEQVWVFGERISDGMQEEIDKAERKNMTIRYFNENCEEVTDINRREVCRE